MVDLNETPVSAKRLIGISQQREHVSWNRSERFHTPVLSDCQKISSEHDLIKKQFYAFKQGKFFRIGCLFQIQKNSIWQTSAKSNDSTVFINFEILERKEKKWGKLDLFLLMVQSRYL